MKRIILCLSLVLIASCTLLVGCASGSKNLAKTLDDTITNLVYSVSSLDWADSELIENLASDNLAYLDDDMDDGIQNISNYNVQNQTGSTTQTDPSYQSAQTTQYSPYMSGSRAERSRLSKNKISRLDNNQNTQIDTINNLNSKLKSTKLTDNMKTISVKYSTENITEQNNEVLQRLSDLVQRRTNILLYVNALYNNKLVLSKEMINAVMAYINIIRDNTAYLNSNKGIVTNQLSQASNIKLENVNSPLINAYIIRTSEAIDTRIAKLDASIEAIDSIIELLDANLSESIIPDMSSYQNNIYTPYLIQNNEIENSHKNNETQENNEKIVIENKTADNDEKTDNKMPTDSENTPNTAENTNIIKNEQNVKIETPSNNNLAESMDKSNLEIINENETTEANGEENTSSNGFIDKKYEEKQNKTESIGDPIDLGNYNLSKKDNIKNTPYTL